ncbi:GL26814 [Drosophila persimilis]|uniref:GL26814 n=1 Tax=Drosophila persimilis TaxID=7234 RepID=B4H2C5_DROPE|nr:GL26814 [Drosophila persimilis]
MRLEQKHKQEEMEMEKEKQPKQLPLKDPRARPIQRPSPGLPLADYRLGDKSLLDLTTFQRSPDTTEKSKSLWGRVLEMGL